MWTTETPKPQPQRSVIEHGPIRLSIGPAHNIPKTWQFFGLGFGLHTDRDHAECQKNWPREALKLAREELDRFEAQLDEEA